MANFKLISYLDFIIVTRKLSVKQLSSIQLVGEIRPTFWKWRTCVELQFQRTPCG